MNVRPRWPEMTGRERDFSDRRESVPGGCESPHAVAHAPKNLIEVLQRHAEHSPHMLALQYLGDGEAVTQTFTYEQLHRRACEIAACLQSHCKVGDRALLLFNDGALNVLAFWGCLYAGVIAVEAQVPPAARSAHGARLQSILRHASPSVILSEAALKDLFRTLQVGDVLPAAQFIVVDELGGWNAAAWQRPQLSADSIAFLQYTSGSTAAPKAVKVGHDNLLANLSASSAACGSVREDTMVSWLPLYHDMGLIGGVLFPVFNGNTLVMMSPQHFAQRPLRWLQAVSRHGGRVSGGPDFAYRLCAEHVSEAARASMDLSSWRIAFCGAEPIRPDTLGAFAKAFAPAGFDTRAVYPCYGLAESTLFVTGGRPGSGATIKSFDAQAMDMHRAVENDTGVLRASCGSSRPAHELLIADPGSLEPLDEGQVGEVLVCGPSVTQGYWKNSSASAQVFIMREGHRFLRTGDLGFLHRGELYITGRLKDLLIVRGRNLYPQDVELAVETQVADVRKGRVAAFSLEHNGEERIVVAAEVTRRALLRTPAEQLLAAISAAVVREFQETVAAIVLLNPGAMPRTSSGKLQRSACRERWLSGSLDTWVSYRQDREADAAGPPDHAGHVPPANETQRRLAGIWTQLLGVTRVGLTDDFFALGGQSLLAAQMLARVRDAFGCELPLRSVFEASVLENFAARLPAQRNMDERPLQSLGRIAPVPLSLAQQRLWFLAQLRPESAAYNIVLKISLRGSLNHELLERAVDALLQRHESLRTTFRVVQGRALQVIHDRLPVRIERVDCQSRNGQSADDLQSTAHVAAIIKKEALTPFDLSIGPLLRIRCLKVAFDRYVLLLSVHHIVSDGWSMQVLLKDLFELYQAQVSGRAALLPDLPIQYADYALWQQHCARDANEAERREHCARPAAADEDGDEEFPPLELPTDRPRPEFPVHSGASLSFSLDPQLTRQLRGLARAQGVTLPMILLAAFKALLYRYSGRSELRVGVTVANRPRLELEPLVGFFVDTQVWRTQLDDDTTFAALVQQVRQCACNVQGHDGLAFEQVVEALNPRRDLAYNPLFQVCFNHQWLDAPYLAPGTIAGLRVEHAEREIQVTQFDLILDTLELGSNLAASFIYSTELFDAATLARLAGHWLNLLADAAGCADKPVARLALMHRAEQAAILEKGRARSAFEPFVGGLSTAFEQQVHLRGAAIAVTDERRSLSYATLNARADVLAQKLRALGVNTEVLVGVYLPRSVELVIGVLGVLKAGGAYLPLDASHPPQHLSEVLADARPRVLLTQQAWRQRLGELPSWLQVLCLENEAALSGQRTAEVERAEHPDQQAYVIYTSGSTGRPKGAQLTHANVLRLLASCREHFEFNSADVWTLFHSCAFDFSVWELFGALLHGARLVIVSYETSRSPQAFGKLLCRERVTVLSQTPSAFSQLLPVIRQSAGALALRYVVFGGEALPTSGVREWFERSGRAGAQLVNMYGITETTVHVTFRRLTTEDAAASMSPVGQPLSDLSAYVLDRYLQPVPVGVAGELYVGGAGLARGYLRRAGLTAQRFLPDPFGNSGARLYRTGDVARWSTTGDLQYVGRSDNQVKVRGYRIELDEIEARLREQPQVRDARVLLRGSGEQRKLVGYVVPERASQPVGQFASSPGPQAAPLPGQWRSVFDETYAREGAVHAPSFAGWTSSYTDQPIPLDEMRQWLAGTVRRIRALQPQAVLEIGCGVGLLVQQLAAGCSRYRGTDLSPRAVARLQGWLQHQPTLQHVELSCQPADLFEGLEHETFDTVILNSVVQYFPDIEYLVRVLEGAARCVRPGGRIFIGDVRHAGLLEHFHTSVQLSRAAAGLSIGQLKSRIARGVLQERELVIDPAFFEALRAQLPIAALRVCWKDETTDNELTRYRYDVVLEVGAVALSPHPRPLPWGEGGGEGQRAAWLLQDAAACRVLKTLPARSTVGQLRERLNSMLAGVPCLEQLPATHHSPLATRFSLDWSQYANEPRFGLLLQQLGTRLRETLKACLPSYMVPAHLIVMDELPLTANGKLDQHSLPEPEGTQGTADYQAPGTAMEQRLALLWQQLLGIERIGLNDNFFDMGGHSLLATQLASRVHAELSVEVPLRELFAAPTLGSFAQRVVNLQRSRSSSGPSLVPRASGLSTMPLSLAQQRLWLVHQLLGPNAAAAYNIAGGFRLRGGLNEDLLISSINALLARHEVLRTAYRAGDDGIAEAVIAEQAEIAIARLDLTNTETHEQQRCITAAALEEASSPFDLAAAPLIRARLITCSNEDHVLLLTVHHIAADGWSVGLLLKELSELYRAEQERRPANLPATTLQYADFACWQNKLLSGAALEDELLFWKRYLAGAPHALPLPTDFPHPPTAALDGGVVRFCIDKPVQQALERIAAAGGVTPYMWLLASFQAFLHRFSNAADLLVGIDVAGRTRVELESLVGFFVNVLPIRSQVAPGMAFKQLLDSTSRSLLDAFEHQALPFDRIVEGLGVVRDRSRNPLVQVLFVLQNAAGAQQLDLPGVQCELLPSIPVYSKFDMALFLEPDDAGLSAQWLFATALFRQQTIERLAKLWLAWLQRLIASQEVKLDQLDWPAAVPRQAAATGTVQPAYVDAKALEHRKLDRLRKVIARQPEASTAIRTEVLNSGQRLPLVIAPANANFNAVSWAKQHGAFIESKLRQHGALLFRNCGLRSVQDFERFAAAIEPELYSEYGDLPKKEGGQRTYRATPYPPDRMILWHNESSHLERWPRKQWFFCQQPAMRGGATPLADCREVLQCLPDDLIARLASRQLMYVRTFTRHLDICWQQFFKTERREEIEQRCRASGTQIEWLPEDGLQMRTVCPALITHPLTGERSFFNQVQLHHPFCLEPDDLSSLLSMVAPERLPRQVYYGDGAPIEEEALRLIGRAYEQCAVRFAWRRGDVLMLDNMLVAHARDPYEGERQIVVAMAQMTRRSDVEVEAPAAGRAALSEMAHNGAVS